VLVDVCFLPSDRVEWYEVATQTPKAAENEA
jgi:hypothetical protein